MHLGLITISEVNPYCCLGGSARTIIASIAALVQMSFALLSLSPTHYMPDASLEMLTCITAAVHISLRQLAVR